MRRPLGALLAVGLAAGLCPATHPAAQTPPAVDALVGQLGAAKFAAREAAAADLLRRGPAAADALDRAAGSHPDPEIRRRAAGLAGKVRRAAEAGRLLAVAPVRLDYDRVPVGAALADLRAKTGIPLTLDDRGVADPTRPVSVKTGDLPPWEAVEAFRQAAGLREVFKDDLGGADPGSPEPAVRVRRSQSRWAAAGGPAESAGQVPVVFADGPGGRLPGERGAAVRVVALPPTFPGNRAVLGAGQVVVNLDVTPAPGVRWDDVAAVRVLRAEDEAGRPVPASHRPDPRPAPANQFEDGLWLGGVGQVLVNGDLVYPAAGPAARPNPRVVPVPLKTDDRAVRSLRVFDGVVVGEVTLPDQPLAAIDGLPAGGAAAGPADSRFAVADYKAHPDGRVTLKFRAEGPSTWAARRGGRRPGFQVSQLVLWDGPAAGGAAVVRFADAAGRPVPAPVVRGSASTEDMARRADEWDLEFPRRPDAGPPARVTVTGNKPATVEVPFRLRDVPLP